ncbi:MAG: DUF3987 domain-containing protein, partial [Saprospiraceae bacterium]|nr:DUF3987 domain-containing protein [Saprospiraceae bacterium]
MQYAGVPRDITTSVILKNFDIPERELMNCIKSAYKRKEQFDTFRHSARTATSKTSTSSFKNSPMIPEWIYKEIPEILKPSLILIENERERDLLFLSLLIVVSSVLGDSKTQYGSQDIFAHLYLFVVARAASGKGSMDLARLIAVRLDEYMLKQHMKEKRSTSSIGGEEKVILISNKEDVHSLLIAGNVSSAGLTTDLLLNGGCGLIIETEADTISNSNEQKWGDTSVMLRKAFHHEMISTSRKEESIKIPYPRLGICLAGTPNQLTRLLQSVENGLFSRFIFYLYSTPPVWIDQFSEDKKNLKNEIEV